MWKNWNQVVVVGILGEKKKKTSAAAADWFQYVDAHLETFR